MQNDEPLTPELIFSVWPDATDQMRADFWFTAPWVDPDDYLSVQRFNGEAEWNAYLCAGICCGVRVNKKPMATMGDLQAFAKGIGLELKAGG